jgi:hypothetical protein
MAKNVITKLTTNGGPCGDGTVVDVQSTGKHETTITCSRCGAARVVKLRLGRVDLPGLARLEDGVRRLHEAN